LPLRAIYAGTKNRWDGFMTHLPHDSCRSMVSGSDAVLASLDLLRSHGCTGISLDRSHGDWSVRSLAFPAGRVLFCAPREAFAMRVEPAAGSRIFVVPMDANAPVGYQGLEIPPGGMGFAMPGVPVILHAKAACRLAIVWPTSGIFKNDGAEFSLVLPPASGGGSDLRELLAGLEHNGPEAMERAVQELSARLNAACREGAESGISKPPRRLASRLQLVLGIWDFIEENTSEELNLDDLVRRSGMSSRTLEYAFTEMAGRTPVGFIKRHRLQQARRLLLEGRTRTVKEAAAACGLWHFGRFSIDYRLQFGEHPSETLRSSKPDAPQLQPAGG
jgi:AraC-like DNA-binding protein